MTSQPTIYDHNGGGDPQPMGFKSPAPLAANRTLTCFLRIEATSHVGWKSGDVVLECGLLSSSCSFVIVAIDCVSASAVIMAFLF